MQQWIQLPANRSKWHAVYVLANGLTYWTYCGLSQAVRSGGIKLSEEPGPRCQGCQIRVKYPYLMPEKLERLLELAR